MERYRKPWVYRYYAVMKVEGAETPWRVSFFVDADEVGHGRYQSWEQADDAGSSFMFSGFGDD